MITSHALQRCGTTAVLILGLKPFDRQAILKMKSKEIMRTMTPSKFLAFDTIASETIVWENQGLFSGWD